MEKDHRLRKLAQNVLQNSVCLQPGEKIYIETSGTLTTDFLTVLIEETIRLGAVPFYYYNDTLLRNALLCNASELQIREHAKLHARIMEQMDAAALTTRSTPPCRAWNKTRCFTGRTPSPFISTSAFRKPNGAFCVIRPRSWRFSQTCRPKSLKIFTFRPV